MLPCTTSYETALIIKVKKGISFDRIPSLEKIFRDIKANNNKVLAFDMSEVDYIDFSGLAFLLEASFKCRVDDIGMIVFGVSQDIMSGIRLSTIDKMLTIFPKDDFEKTYKTNS